MNVNGFEMEKILSKFNEHIVNIVKNNFDNLTETLFDYRGDKLVYLNEYLFSKEYDRVFYIDRYSYQINIEHIMPQSKDNQLATPGSFVKSVTKLECDI